MLLGRPSLRQTSCKEATACVFCNIVTFGVRYESSAGPAVQRSMYRIDQQPNIRALVVCNCNWSLCLGVRSPLLLVPILCQSQCFSVCHSGLLFDPGQLSFEPPPGWNPGSQLQCSMQHARCAPDHCCMLPDTSTQCACTFKACKPRYLKEQASGFAAAAVLHISRVYVRVYGYSATRVPQTMTA